MNDRTRCSYAVCRIVIETHDCNVDRKRCIYGVLKIVIIRIYHCLFVVINFISILMHLAPLEHEHAINITVIVIVKTVTETQDCYYRDGSDRARCIYVVCVKTPSPRGLIWH